MKRRISAVLLATAMALGPAATTASALTHTVVKGDNLSALAGRYLGSTQRWQEIYEANKDIIANPNLIHVGQVLTIPDNGQSSVSGTPVRPQPPEETQPVEPQSPAETAFDPALLFDRSAWQYDAAVNCYYQIGVGYCTAPESLEHETLAIYVPGEYMHAVDNGDGTYTCTVNAAGQVNGFRADTAPIVIPVKTPGYMALAAQSKYDFESARSYVNAGFIYVHAGCRGRNNIYSDSGALLASGGAPWGVTDLKAAVRYLRLNSDLLPGSTDTIYTFGMSGGGAQSALMGTSGNSTLYKPYLEQIGAAMTYPDGTPISDAVTGSMCWCPVTSLDIADASYEWNMGQYSSKRLRADGSWGSALSEDLSNYFAQYVNKMGFRDEEGNLLVLTEGGDGIYAAGSYYDYLIKVINTSLNNYLTDQGEGAAYIARLNEQAGKEWISYNDATGTASVSSMADFAAFWKLATKEVGAFDDLSGTQPENRLFGNDQSDAVHYSDIMAGLIRDNATKYAALDNWNPNYVDAYAQGISSRDKLGTSIKTRQDMYNPLYYIHQSSAGYGTSTPARHWRINTGLMQGDTALTTEVGLYLDLVQLDGTDVSFTTVWDKPHVEAERANGNYTENFIDWVFSCENNTTQRTTRLSGAGESTKPESSAAPETGGQSAYTLAEGYDKFIVFDFVFEAMNQTVPILASANEDETRINLQFDFFEDKQDVSLELTDGTWKVTADKSGFLGTDGLIIAAKALEIGTWNRTAKKLESPYQPVDGYELYEIFEFRFADMDQTVVVLASSNTVHTRMNLQFDFFEDKQDVSLELINGAWEVTADKSGFLSIDGPIIAEKAVELDQWIIK